MQTLTNSTGSLELTPLPDGKLKLKARCIGFQTKHDQCVTDYPLPLIQAIFDEFGAGYTCEEIGRDIDPTDAALDVRLSIEAHLEDEFLKRPLRILDYGSGAGSSMLALARFFPNASITGLDQGAAYVNIAKLRIAHFGINATAAVVDPSGAFEQRDFDVAFLNAVYEHLLPNERPSVIASIWKALKPGGILILNQTPHRWFPIETHTTGLPLLNYLPKPLVQAWVRRRPGHLSQADWPTLLRAGIRGSTVAEIMRNIHRVDPGAVRVKTLRVAKSWAGIWYVAKQARGAGSAVRLVHGAVEALHLPFSPYVNIAVRKSA